MNTITYPKVDKGIPAPAPLKARRLWRGRPVAPWRVFLAGLVAGDSFKVLSTSVDCLRGHASALGIELRQERTGEMADHNTPLVRVWRV